MELKPCPFCGGQPSLRIEKPAGHYWNGKHQIKVSNIIWCSCGKARAYGWTIIDIDSFNGKVTTREDGMATASEAWNMRADK